jgi:hypothetical protein
MRLVRIALVALGLIVSISVHARDTQLRFEGGIGVIPTSRVDPPVSPATVPTVVRNDVRGLQPGGQPWVIARLEAKIGPDGSIRVNGRGLLLAGGNGIGTTGNQSVRAVLFCGPAASPSRHDSELVTLEADGDFRIGGELTPLPPNPCDTPVLLIVNPMDRWFAAGIVED